jgi:hypothetical protein
MEPHDTHQLAAEAATGSGLAKAAPPVAVSAASLAGMPLSDWVLIATLAYTALQFYIAWRDKLGGRGQLSRLRRWLRSWTRTP